VRCCCAGNWSRGVGWLVVKGPPAFDDTLSGVARETHD
jgi:hypothetical protein